MNATTLGFMVRPLRMSLTESSAHAATFGAANVLSLRRTRPSRAGQTATRTCEARGAEAPGPANGRVSPAAKS